MNETQSMEVFHSAPVPKAVFINAMPAIAAMMMVLIYNLADTFFIGQTGDPFQIAAISLAMPLFLIFMSVGIVFGVGGTSVISRTMGEGKTEYTKKVCAFCMWGCVIVGVALSALFLVFMDRILPLIGASADTWLPAKTYLSIVCLSGPFVLVSNCFSNVLRAQGQSGKAMVGMLVGNLINVVLDPIMILGFGWNIAGAAIATVIGNVIGAAYYILYFLRGKSFLSISPKDFTLKNKVCSAVLAIGVPASLASVLMSVSQIIVNSQMAGYGDMTVAGMGVAMKVVIITGMTAMGLGQGVQPLLGYCVGAKLWERFRKVLKFSLCFSFGLSIALTALCYLFTNQIVGAFLTDADAFAYAVSLSWILLTTSALFGVFFVLTNALQAMGAAVSSLIINVSRQGFIYIPAVFVLQALLGVTGPVWAQPVADLLSIGIAVILYLKTAKRMMKEPELQDVSRASPKEATAD